MSSFLVYAKIAILGLLSILILRGLETYWALRYQSLYPPLLQSELWGSLYDLLFLSFASMLAFPFYYLLQRFSIKLANTVFVLLILLWTITNFIIINYFAYQLIPLDIFLYNYEWREILFTVKTSTLNIAFRFFILSIIVTFLITSFHYVKKVGFTKRLLYILCFVGLVNSVVFATLQFSQFAEYDLFSMSKSNYFYSQSLTYFLQNKTDEYSAADAYAYQQLHSENSYVSIDYPLQHTFENNKALDPYFKKFDKAPNIVILIVEGLNDDFIHSYKGVNLMPFLSALKNKSLYWNKCFTLGERSFAVVPSLTGSLPYGDIGFMQLERYPNHLSLVSILKSNDYQTNFFYGQGKWFHNKGKYFTHNTADLVFDNENFEEKYKKILVGPDKFFWGYHDKDLFNQSLSVIDTMRKQNRLDIYFTGTSHSPYVIDDTAYYENKFSQLIKNTSSKEDAAFFNTYKKYILTELFVDDAISAFMEDYKKIKNYENTIFIITGDHPMTELPRANELKKYHVPLIIYSPKLKESKTFTQIASHLDVYESLLSLLSTYELKIPATSSAIGYTLNTTTNKRNDKIAFMNGNRQVVDYLSSDYFLSGQQLYTINADLSLTKSTDKFREAALRNELAVFNRLNLHVCQKNKILSDSLYCTSLNHTLLNSQQVDTLIIQVENKEMLNLPITSENHVFEISFAYEGKGDKDLHILYEVKSDAGKMVLWQSCGTTSDTKQIQYRVNIPKQTNTKSPLTLKIWFHNPSKKISKLTEFRIMVYKS